MLKKIIYFLFFVNTAVYSQVKKIQFISDENHLPISDVEVYDGNSLIGKSDLNGFLNIKPEDLYYLRILKEDYNDAFIKVADLQEKVILIKNKPIQLEEVVIGKTVKINLKKTLNRIQENLENFHKGNKRYKLPDYYHITNKLLMETDTLQYLNGLIKGGPIKEVGIDKNFRLVKKYKYATKKINNQIIQATNIYSINKKEIQLFFGINNIPYIIDNDFIITHNILEKRKDYNYKVTNIGNLYKVEFVSKKLTPFGFNGYFIVDQKDYGIYEFKAYLSEPNKDNVEDTYYSFINDKQKYHITKSDYYTKYQKDENGIYRLICSYSDKKFEQIEGNFKGVNFSYSCKTEISDNDKNKKFVSFDLVTYELN